MINIQIVAESYVSGVFGGWLIFAVQKEGSFFPVWPLLKHLRPVFGILLSVMVPLASLLMLSMFRFQNLVENIEIAVGIVFLMSGIWLHWLLGRAIGWRNKTQLAILGLSIVMLLSEIL